MFEDRRTYPRRKAMLTLRVLFGDAELSCVTTDVSPTGAFLAARNALPAGEKIDIVVRPAGVKMPPVRLHSEVVRVNPIGGPHQPGFAVRFISAHSETGGEPIYHVLRRVLRVPEIMPEHLPTDGVVQFDFPEVGERFDLRADAAPRAVSVRGTGRRMTGRPSKPIGDALPKRGSRSRMRPPPAEIRRPSDNTPRVAAEDLPEVSTAQPQRRRSSASGRPSFTVSTTARKPRRTSKSAIPKLTVTSKDERRVLRPEEQTDGFEPEERPPNPFLGARPAAASADSDVFQPPSQRRSSTLGPTRRASRPATSAEERRPSAPSARPAPPERRPSAPTARRRSTGNEHPAFSARPAPPAPAEAGFDPSEQDTSDVFTAETREVSDIVAPFASKLEGRRKSDIKTWSRYESGVHSSATVRRTSDIIIQDDPFATGARKVAKRFRDREEEQRKKRQAAREAEREKLRERLAQRRRESRPMSGSFSAEGEPVGERSMIFSRDAQNSTIGGPMLTGVAEAPGLPDGASVKTQLPVSYELDGRFVPGTLVSAAPLAAEIHSDDRVPQLDQKLVVNMPVRVESGWRTIFLMGKLLRVPERQGEGMSFVLHIERVQEHHHKGAYSRFLAETHAATQTGG